MAPSRRISFGAALVLAACGLVSAAPSVAGTTAARAGLIQSWGTTTTDLSGGGYPDERHTPGAVALPGGVRATAAAAGSTNFVAIGSDHHLYGWGLNQHGEVGDGTTKERPKPVRVKLPAGVKPVSVAAGGAETLMAGSDGRLYAWGDNSTGGLGTGKSKAAITTPTPVHLPAGVRAVAMSATDHTLVIGSDHRLYAWGANIAGQVGDGSTKDRTLPKVITLPKGVKPVQVAAGGYHSLAIGSDHHLYAWGDNSAGALGTGDKKSHRVPTLAKFPSGVTPTRIVGLYSSSLAIGSDHQLYGWGYGAFGTLGDGNSKVHNRLTPYRASLPRGVQVTAIAGRIDFELAVGSDGKLYSWGANSNGQLGDGTTKSRAIPTAVPLIGKAHAFAVAAGSYRSIVLTS
jgi:alpha-tubulin suppressor-like RCC1 family protein